MFARPSIIKKLEAISFKISKILIRSNPKCLSDPVFLVEGRKVSYPKSWTFADEVDQIFGRPDHNEVGKLNGPSLSSGRKEGFVSGVLYTLPDEMDQILGRPDHSEVGKLNEI